MFGLLLKGFILGFSVSAPIGPIGVLCVRRTAADGFTAGWAVGLGATAADSLYAAVAALGLTAVASSLVAWEKPLRLIAAVILFSLAWRAAQPREPDRPVSDRRGGFLGGFGSGFAILITNPAAILIFGAVFAGVGLVGNQGTTRAAAAIVVGVVLGSQAWWVLLNGVVSILRKQLRARAFRVINVSSAVILVAFGVLALLG